MRGVLTCLVASIALAVQAQSLDNLFETALGTAGLTQQDATFDTATVPFYFQSNQPTLLYNQCMAHPWRVPTIMRSFKDELATAADQTGPMLATGSKMLGVGVNRSLLGSPVSALEDIAKRRGALVSTIEKMRQLKLVSSATPSLNSVPEPVQEAAALVLNAAMQSASLRRAAFQRVPDVTSLFNAMLKGSPDNLEPEEAVRLESNLERVDLHYLFAGSQDLAIASTTARSRLLGVDPSEKFYWRMTTAWGDIVLTGGDNREHSGAVLLLIDTGGDDQYINLPANKSTTNWCSIVLDSAGNDRYLSSAELAQKQMKEYAGRSKSTGPGPACGVLGYSMLFDLRGNDLYRSAAPGLGAGLAGIGIISDVDGDDKYDAYTQAEGYATYGAGIVEDQDGTDSYTCFGSAQGHGGPQGFGLLLDRFGNDSYVANNTELDFPSPQTAQNNVSMAQGAATGRRADYTDGKSTDGGIGVLYDLAGDDQYSCGVFGQGVGYWGGVGLLWDRAGNDRYSGQWYVQGSTAHFSVGYLEDEGGNDTYTAKLNMAQGAAHDFSLSYLVDRAGNDRYEAPNLSLGAGNANGIGIFMDFDGDDQYFSTGLTLGRGAEAPKSSLRERCLTLGLFYDGAGTDIYPQSTSWARDSSRVTNWTDRGYRAAESQLGIFWDR